MRKPRIILDAFIGGLLIALILTPPLWMLDWALGIDDAEMFLMLGVLGGAALTGWGSWRRKVEIGRRRAGLCPHCGYDIRASVDRCPECGKPFKRREYGQDAHATTPPPPTAHTEAPGSSARRS